MMMNMTVMSFTSIHIKCVFHAAPIAPQPTDYTLNIDFWAHHDDEYMQMDCVVFGYTVRI